jgi:hypothetical protein
MVGFLRCFHFFLTEILKIVGCWMAGDQSRYFVNGYTFLTGTHTVSIFYLDPFLVERVLRCSAAPNPRCSFKLTEEKPLVASLNEAIDGVVVAIIHCRLNTSLSLLPLYSHSSLYERYFVTL